VRTIVAGLRELAGLFIDDWRTSVGVVVWLAVGASALPQIVANGEVRAVALFAGLAAVLVASVALAAWSRGSRR
jgi:hypothetical protein